MFVADLLVGWVQTDVMFDDADVVSGAVGVLAWVEMHDAS